MITFENDTGRVHPQTPHFEVMEESKDMGSEIDMGFVVNGELDKLKDVLSCPFSIAAVLYTLCSDQIEERELTPEEFSELLYGDTFEKAVEALIESILDFFPRQKAQVLRDALAKEKARQDKELEKALEELSKD